jgi:hypothetical protein
MGGYGALAMLILAGLAALDPALMSWVYVAAAIGFELWLMRRMARAGTGPVPVDAAPRPTISPRKRRA